jgi:hypothetical protein
MVHKHGRITESMLVTKMLLKTGLGSAVREGLGMWRLGLWLLKTRRFSMRTEGIKRKEELAKMMAVAEKVNIDQLQGKTKPVKKGVH